MSPRISGSGLLSGLVARVRSTWRDLRRREQVEAEMLEEFRHHVELRTEDLVRSGLSPGEAARRARLEFGHVERHREEARSARGLRGFDQLGLSWLDVKLGARMLAKYPGLSAVSVVGMAVAIAIGAGAFSAIGAMMDPALPLPESERIVSLQNSTDNPGNPDRQALHDFLLWRQEMTTVEHLTAFRTEVRNLILPDGGVHLVPVAEMSPSGFRVAGVPPLMGRPLVDEDERPAGTPVIVIAHEEWERRFGGRSDILGQTIRLGESVHTIVGVMPEGFRFPVNHRYWVPLRLNPGDHPVGGGPALQMFGRLASGVPVEEAQAELATLGRRMAAEFPETHRDLRPQILPYAHPFFDIDTPAVALAYRGLQGAVSLLLLLVALNVAVLIYARTATRTAEITVRTALGASRRRIITQLFAEALVLSSVAAGIGLLVAALALEQVQAFLARVSNHNFPFWFDVGLTPSVAVYVAALAVVAGLIVGVIPALKATGPRVQAGLQRLSARGSGMQLGRTWTGLIVTQVALAVAILPFALFLAGSAVQRGTGAAPYPVDEVLVGWLSIEREDSPPADRAAAYQAEVEARFAEHTTELFRRLQSEPAVAGASFAANGIQAARYARVEVEGGETHSALASDVAPDLFDVLGLPVLAGRGFVPADTLEEANAVLVDRVFAQLLGGGGEVLGRRVRELRYVPGERGEPGTWEEGAWQEIVGVVPAHGTQPDLDPANPRLYRATGLQGAPYVGLAIRVRGGEPFGFAPRLRDITASVDPLLQLHSVRTAEDVERDTRQGLLFLGLVIAAVTTSVLLLSAAGIYAMMSFTVARRRREIGIRAALGAAPARVIRGIFARAGTQLGLGVAAGLLLALVAARAMGGGPFHGSGLLLLPLVAAVILAVGLLATVGPARRVLAIQPRDALQEE